MTDQNVATRIITLKGKHAISSFRREKLLKAFGLQGFPVTDIQAVYIHMAEVADSWSENHTRRLAELLGHEADGYEAKENDELFLVVPRLGTISPWSSKATDIARLCGLDVLKRLERGIAYTVSGGFT